MSYEEFENSVSFNRENLEFSPRAASSTSRQNFVQKRFKPKYIKWCIAGFSCILLLVIIGYQVHLNAKMQELKSTAEALDLKELVLAKINGVMANYSNTMTETLKNLNKKLNVVDSKINNINDKMEHFMIPKTNMANVNENMQICIVYTKRKYMYEHIIYIVFR